MSDYIINPVLLYILSIADDIKMLFLGIVAVLSIGIIILLVVYYKVSIDPKYISYTSSLSNMRKMLKPLCVLSIIFLVLSILFPSTETMYQIVTASIVNNSNVDLTIDTLKDIVEYIKQVASMK